MRNGDAERTGYPAAIVRNRSEFAYRKVETELLISLSARSLLASIAGFTRDAGNVNAGFRTLTG